MTPSSHTSILVPLKKYEKAKSRLQPPLTRNQRQQFSRALYEQTLDVLETVTGHCSGAVVTNSDLIAATAGNRGISVFTEDPHAKNLGEIVDLTLRTNRKFFGESLLVLPGDLPLISRPRVLEYLSICQGNSVVLNPDQEREGTNAIWRSPPEIVACQYEGTSSFKDHLDVARNNAITPKITGKSWISKDFDTIDDLLWLKDHLDELSEALRKVVLDVFDRESVLEFPVDSNPNYSRP